MTFEFWIVGSSLLSLVFFFIMQLYFSQRAQQKMAALLNQEQTQFQDKFFQNLLQNQQLTHETLNQFSRQNAESHQQNLYRLQNTLRESLLDFDKQIHTILGRTTASLTEQFEKLQTTTQNQLFKITESVEVKLTQGFEKTNETFANIIKRLAIIDDAQKKITDLSQNVVSLQEILADKRARGAFGEVQLQALIRNVLPEQNYHLQHTLSNGTRVDCLLLLPHPTGNIAIDAKFPLENYQKYANHENEANLRQAAKQQFKLDIKKHIQDISQKYIIPGETSDGALLFIPAEAIFAEIHANHPDLVEFAFQARVWLASPSTMMAILTTACAVLKDSATRQQVHIIQQHLSLLAKDFSRFEKRMDNLSRHLQQANLDAEQVHTSAQKITKRFSQIEKVEIEFLEEVPLTLEENSNA